MLHSNVLFDLISLIGSLFTSFSKYKIQIFPKERSLNTTTYIDVNVFENLFGYFYFIA